MLPFISIRGSVRSSLHPPVTHFHRVLENACYRFPRAPGGRKWRGEGGEGDEGARAVTRNGQGAGEGVAKGRGADESDVWRDQTFF